MQGDSRDGGMEMGGPALYKWRRNGWRHIVSDANFSHCEASILLDNNHTTTTTSTSTSRRHPRTTKPGRYVLSSPLLSSTYYIVESPSRHSRYVSGHFDFASGSAAGRPKTSIHSAPTASFSYMAGPPHLPCFLTSSDMKHDGFPHSPRFMFILGRLFRLLAIRRKRMKLSLSLCNVPMYPTYPCQPQIG